VAETRRGMLMPAPLRAVTIEGGFWGPRVTTNRQVTLKIEHAQCKKTGRIDAWKLDWRPGMPNEPHKFWDSDVAKWIEAAAYSLATHPDKRLEKHLDEVIDLIADAQQPDGYLNIHYTVVEPDQRWRNLAVNHELYCAGHLMEAAVALLEATGKRTLLDCLCRYADYIDSVFGHGKSRRRGAPGHEEIELALVRLTHATGEARYLKLAKFFIDERGRRPNVFDIEARARGEAPENVFGNWDYCQAHLPVRRQTTAEGHAVRAMYLYCGMADVAADTGDKALLAACKRLWKNVVERRMYVTGGIGSIKDGERFTYDYDLPNEIAYNETCAAIGLVFWAHRMLQIEPDGGTADVMERALYNGTISGVSLDGKRFFYDNLLAVHPKAPAFRGQKPPAREPWFGCACCPPNIARLLASLGGYAYSQGPGALYAHLYIQGRAELTVGGQTVALVQKTEYPWKETVRLTVRPERPARFTLALRIPGWCRAARLKVNGKPTGLARITKRGYARLTRLWRTGDTVELRLSMPVERIEAHPSVREDCGRVALMRGPVVYCLEQIDNGPDLHDITLPAGARLQSRFEPETLGGVVTVTATATHRDPANWRGRLYRPTGASRKRRVRVKAVPYYAWANRGPGEMLVWIRSD